MILGITKKVVVLDTETSSPVDIKKSGQYVYWAHPGTKVLMTAAKPLGGDRAQVWDHEARKQPLPKGLVDLINAPPSECMLAAANSEFDRFALARLGYPTPPEKWLDVLVLAYVLGFSGRLADVLSQTPLKIQKNPEGSRCISTFSVQLKRWQDYPELWDKFVAYCSDDADVEERLLRWCLQWLDTDWMRPSVQTILRQELIYRDINGRGIPIDTEAVEGALQIIEQETEFLMEQLRLLTGLDNPNSRDQLLRWCRERRADIPDLTKATVAWLVDDPTTPEDVVQVLSLRQELNKSSTKKYASLKAATGADGRLRGGWQFYGASRTGRVAGRILNPANLPRPTLPQPEAAAEWLRLGDRDILQMMVPGAPLQTLSSTIRACLKAPNGLSWCVADLTSIESVGSAWLAGCDTVLDIFFAGRDTYKSFAVEAFKVAYEDVTKKQRTYSKPVVLGAGYRMSGAGLCDYAKSMGVDLTEDDAYAQVALFRELYHEIVHLWQTLENAAIQAVENPGDVFYARAVAGVADEWVNARGKTRRTYYYKDWPRVAFRYDGTFLFCALPSGRFLCYYRPEVEEIQVTPRRGEPFTTTNISYMGIDQKATGTNAWCRIFTHGGKLLENCNQAICRDIMWHGLEPAHADPAIEVVGDIYDELPTLSADPGALDRLTGYMTTRPLWADERFYLGADGYVSARYRKD